ncbi:amino acid ABC transporter ATP-binding protein [Rhodospirillaceae bacterium KN72]|uniref:Amino acid ABC transporter ATP-binding protein n=1 Tax=Pacificispira spongiicola TaxID=2729598 RepID=A0A7Y0DX02_9PROT|nr:amino acid ABC transporter ATP-binding protein [Pacificispira spongiicola]NMM43169.1 amino acid ABC transporter ATP-binding protein [Pacificispira spongiicola]
MTENSSSPANALITARGLGKHYGTFQALSGIDLDILKSEVTCLIGPSGSGKSTLLRCLNFLEAYDEGEVRIDGQLVGWQDGKASPRKPVSATKLREQRRQVGMVFQQFNLWPHMTAAQNVAEALVQVKGLSKAEARDKAILALARVNLRDKADNHPSALSGGQQQRVAIARAIAMEPRVVLFDEPTSALDPELVGEVLNVMRDLAADGMTMVVVTHEMGFAAHVANRVAFLDHGKLVACVPPDEIFRQDPADPRIRSFLQTYRERNVV